MISRYDNRRIYINDDETYEEVLERKGIKSLRQYGTPKLRQPTAEEMRNLVTENHIWKLGDRYWKLADAYYGDARLWWVIAWFNNKPTEAHLKMGQIVYIPMPLEKVLRYYDL